LKKLTVYNGNLYPLPEAHKELRRETLDWYEEAAAI
jgi:hypothetical protein